MPEPIATTATDAAAADQDDSTTSEDAIDDTDEGADQLGDAGKRALDAMKAQRNAARAEQRQAKQELDALKAQIDERGLAPDEKAIAEAKREATAEATKTANRRILAAEIRAAAAGKLTDPADALLHLKLDDYAVSDDGEVDQEELSAAIADLLKRKPYLAAMQSGPVVPSAGIDQGARDRSAPDLQQQAAKALSEGRIQDAIQLKQQLVAAARKP